MKKVLFILLSSLTSLIYAQTTISGGVVEGVWSLDGSPYTVTGSIMIQDGHTLTIESGVTVEFDGPNKIVVLGTFLSLGTETDSVYFRPLDIVEGWKGIIFNETPTGNDSSKITYSSIIYSKAEGSGEENVGGGIYLKNYSKVIVSNSRIANNYAYHGAGIYCDNSSPKFTYNLIANNNSNRGAGIYCNNSSPLIEGNTFLEDSCSGMEGGAGIFCENESSPQIIGNNFYNNFGANGAGVCSFSGNPVIIGNTFNENTAASSGGAIFSNGINSKAYIFNNIITNNYSEWKAGALTCSSGDVVKNNIILNNESEEWGGALSAGGTAEVYGNIISNNISERGGAVYMGGRTKFVNNIICNNSSTIEGGAIYMYGDSSSFINNTIVNNESFDGGGLFLKSNSNTFFANNIIWGNTANEGEQVFLFDEDSDPTFKYCNIEGGVSSFELNGNFYFGEYTNNINANPLFILPTIEAGNNYEGASANWRLQSNSTSIDAGTPDTIGLNLPPVDYDGNPRLIGNIDMGVFETGSIQIAENNKELISVYPTLTTGEIYIKGFDIDYLEVINISGLVILKQLVNKTNFMINISGNPKGVYYVKFTTSKGIETKKVIIK